MSDGQTVNYAASGCVGGGETPDAAAQDGPYIVVQPQKEIEPFKYWLSHAANFT